MACLVGITPVEYGALEGVERAWTDAVVRRAWELRIDELRARALAPT